jgi:hypothetical protein
VEKTERMKEKVCYTSVCVACSNSADTVVLLSEKLAGVAVVRVIVAFLEEP